MATRLGMIRPVEEHLSTGDRRHRALAARDGHRRTAPSPPRASATTRCSSPAIEDSEGRVIYRAPGGKRGTEPQVARTVTDVLSPRDPGHRPEGQARPTTARSPARPGPATTRPTHGSPATRPQLDRGGVDGRPEVRARGHGMTNVGGVTGVRRDVPGDDLAEVHGVARSPTSRSSRSRRRTSRSGRPRHG